MFLSKLRYLAAGVLAVAATVGAPGQSRADTQVLVAEVQVDGSGNVVMSGGNPVLIGGYQAYTGSPLATKDFANIQVNSTRSGTGAAPTASLTTTVTANPNGTGGTLTGNYGLQVIYKDYTFLNSNSGGMGFVTNNAGVSGGLLSPGTNTASVTTQVFSTAPFPPSSAFSPFATNYGAPTGTATATIDQNNVTTLGPPVATTSAGNLPAWYGIQQTIYIISQSQAGQSDSSSLGGTLSSTVVTAPPPSAVPAPAGIVLALAAVPVLGLRRVIRRKGDVA